MRWRDQKHGVLWISSDTVLDSGSVYASLMDPP
jgi:hypothetical protein